MIDTHWASVGQNAANRHDSSFTGDVTALLDTSEGAWFATRDLSAEGVQP